MILISKNKVNDIYVTAFELVNLNFTPFDYLLYIINNLTGEEYSIVLEDLSPCPNRYQHFKLDEPNDLELNSGYYEYTIYQILKPLDEVKEITDAKIVKVLEVGKFLVEKLKDQKIPEFDTTFDKNVQQWNG